jgi:hypothetical protein
MVSNETITTINYIKDIEFEYNIKLILLGLMFLYSVVFLYISYKWQPEYVWGDVINIGLFRAPTIAFLFFAPLTVFYLFRGVSWEVIYTLLIAVFSYAFIVFLVCLNVGLWTYFAEMVGIDMKTKKIEMKR